MRISAFILLYHRLAKNKKVVRGLLLAITTLLPVFAVVDLVQGFAEEPLRFRDPYSGQTGEEWEEISTIHNDLTFALALAAGFSVSDSITLQIWDQLVDSEHLGPGDVISYTNCTGGAFYPTPNPDVVCGLKPHANVIWPMWNSMQDENSCVTSRFGPYSPFFHFPHNNDQELGALHDWGWGLTNTLTAYEAYAWGRPVEFTVLQASCLYTRTAVVTTDIQAGSLEAFATYLHSLADYYSHQECIAHMDSLEMPWATHTLTGHPACNYNPINPQPGDVHGSEFYTYTSSLRTDAAIQHIYSELVARSLQREGEYFPLGMDTPLAAISGTPTLSETLYIFVHEWDFEHPAERRMQADLIANAALVQRVPAHRIYLPLASSHAASASISTAGLQNLSHAHWMSPQEWGEPITGTTTYTIYKQDFVYGTEPFTTTDVRLNDGTQIYSDKVGYENRALTVYRAHDGQSLLDNQPVVFFVHGGAWIDGYRDWYEFVARSFTGEKGWVTVVIDYRLTSDQVFITDQYCPDRDTCNLPENEPYRTKSAWYSDNIRDVASAFQWTIDHIEENGGNGNQIVVFGHSAGGHLASLLATHTDYETSLRPAIKGLVSMSGVYKLNDLTPAIWASAITQTFHGGFDNPTVLDQASPSTYVTSNTVSLPPSYLLYAETELPDLTQQSIAFKTNLATFGFDVAISHLTGYGHATEMAAIADINETPTTLIVDWIKNVLQERVYLPLVVIRRE
ncbi:MAG: alpha/beta hydrolase [Anaerolineae bacterium]|nr:alpha/beta hydrolase [Anaerolineae bacterium]